VGDSKFGVPHFADCSNGRPLRRIKLVYSDCGLLKDVSRKAFQAAAFSLFAHLWSSAL
jgi:hypothetical protein